VHVQAQSGSAKPETLKVASRTDLSALAKAASRPNAVIEAVWQGTVKLTKPIIVGQGTNLTIIGENVATAIGDGGGKTQLFDVSELANLVLVDMTLTNGFSDANGGAVSIGEYATLKARGVVFSNNNVRAFLDFDDNEQRVIQAIGLGGAVYGGVDSTINISNCTFSKNTASVAGGGIASSSTLPVDIKNSLFDNNAACVSNRKKADCYGGGAVAYNESITIKGSTFENNNVASATSDNWGDGGAVLNLAIPNVGGDATSPIFGGDDYLYSSSSSSDDEDTLDYPTTKIINSIFMNNTAGSRGGAAHLKGTVTLTLCHFKGNHAFNEGGAVHIFKWSMTTDKCNFTDNLADFNGGAVLLGDDPQGYLNVTDSFFTNNSCGGDGAAIFGKSSSSLEARFSSFSSNTADGNGGAIYIIRDLSVAGLVTVKACEFISNKATIGGAIFSDFVVNFLGALLANNTASSGGAMRLTSTLDLLSSVTLINNTASSQGNINHHRNFMSTLSNIQRRMFDTLIYTLQLHQQLVIDLVHTYAVLSLWSLQCRWCNRYQWQLNVFRVCMY
jgi:predicted outer membrane repeat protein